MPDVRAERSSPLGRALYALGYVFFLALYKTVWRVRVAGRENVPREGGLIIAANHASWGDPPLVGCTMPRVIHFLAKQELFEVPGFGWLIRQVNAVPIKRVERDVGAFRTAQRILARGGVLIVFPEGTRQRAGGLGRPKAGVGMLAAKTGRPVVPVYIHDTHHLLSFRRIHVYYGAPMTANGDADYQEFSNKVMAAIAAMREGHLGSTH